MDDELRQQIIELLKGSMTLEVDTSSEYTGGMDGQDLYEDRHTLKLMIDGELIAEASL